MGGGFYGDFPESTSYFDGEFSNFLEHFLVRS